ncbi:MAG: beta-glucosidase BglX [Bacteroidia bacterium]|nr:beta-glucosidase BglX [Bacteroidia bacterium]
MKRYGWLGLLLLAALQAGAQDARMNAFVSSLMNKMTVDEKIGQLNLVTPGGPAVTGAVVSTNVEEKIRKGEAGGIFGLWGEDKVRKVQEIAVNESRLKIPLIFGLDVIHGHRTIFPIPLAVSCTWDMAMIERSARMAALEATADGLNWTFSPMVDIARDPRWGRIAEGGGEDPYLGAQIARAMVRGYQGDNLADPTTLMACVKHFALYGAGEAGRDYNTVDMSRLQMYQDYLPPYKAAVEAGAGSVMTSFNIVDGLPATGNRWLMTDLLRTQWGFRGMVVTDYTAVKEMTMHGLGDLQAVSALALKAGVDMDMVSEGFLATLKQSLAQGKVTQKEIDLACRRILEAKYKLGLFDDPYRYCNAERARRELLSADKRQFARELAARSAVLLKNDNQTLPLKPGGTVALIGPMADNRAEMFGTWTIGGDPNHPVTVREGIAKAIGDQGKILYAKGANFTDDPEFLRRAFPWGGAPEESRSPGELLEEALTAARRSDVVVAVLGESSNMSGEAASRTRIGLPENQLKLLQALHATGKPVVLVIFSGRPLTLTWEQEHLPAILMGWFGGIEAGNAIADVLYGAYNPAGKLSTTFPRSVGQIPLYYNHKPTGRPLNPNDKFTTKYLDESNEPLYPFGYGLSYTSFAYSDIRLSSTQLKGAGPLTASVTVTNTGKLAGEEVVQLYLSDPAASVSRAVKELKGFQKIMLAPGESREVQFSITPEQLKFYNSALQYDWESGEFGIQIGGNSRDVKQAKVVWTK